MTPTTINSNIRNISDRFYSYIFHSDPKWKLLCIIYLIRYVRYPIDNINEIKIIYTDLVEELKKENKYVNLLNIQFITRRYINKYTDEFKLLYQIDDIDVFDI